MKIILCIINFGLILSLGSAQYNAFTVTRFPQLDTFLQNSVKLSTYVTLVLMFHF